VLDVEPEVRVAGRDQLLARRLRGIERIGQVLLFGVERALDQRQVETFFAAEVNVDRAGGDVGVRGDVLDLRTVETLVEEVALGRSMIAAAVAALRRSDLDGACVTAERPSPMGIFEPYSKARRGYKAGYLFGRLIRRTAAAGCPSGSNRASRAERRPPRASARSP